MTSKKKFYKIISLSFCTRVVNGNAIFFFLVFESRGR